MTAADLVAGARALIEPLNGRNLFEAAPVMRDTIEALLDDRDALTQRIEALEGALRIAEAALADIGDAEREPWDDVPWLEKRAAKALPAARAALQADEVAQ